MRTTFWAKAAFLASGLCLIAGVYGRWLLLYFPAVVLASAAAWMLLKQERPGGFLSALPLVLICLILPPDLSTDHHRYLWEGHVQNQGYSPYQHAPASLYDTLEHPSEGKVNHANLTAIYPPLAQYLFRLSTIAGPSVYAWKLLIVLGLMLLWFFPAGTKNSWWWLIAPPLLFEGVWNGHLDAVGIVPACWMMVALERQKGLQAGIALGCAIAIKIMPLLLLPVAFLALVREQRMKFVFGLIASLVILYLPFLGQLPDLFNSFRAFADNWHFNNPLFLLLKAGMAPELARRVMALCLILACGGVLLVWRDARQRMSAVWLALCFFSPTVYPWYLLWLLPFAPKDKRHFALGIYAASFLSYIVLYEYRLDGRWNESWLWLIPEWTLILWWARCLLKRSPAAL